jgi:hypothetical protein
MKDRVLVAQGIYSRGFEPDRKRSVDCASIDTSKILDLVDEESFSNFLNTAAHRATLPQYTEVFVQRHNIFYVALQF